MTNGNYKPIGLILWKILKNPLCSELTYEEAAEYALEFIRLLGAPVAYISKPEKIKLSCYKAEMPCDVLYLEGAKYLGRNEGQDYNGIAMRESTNVYHVTPGEVQNLSEYTYKVQKGIFFASKEEGYVQLIYKAIATDEEGMPLIPDDQDVLLGMEYYVMSRYLEPLWLVGKVTDKAFEYINQKRYFYMPAAFTSLQMPGVDKMESIMNGLNRILINDSAHQNFFRNYGEQERIKRS